MRKIDEGILKGSEIYFSSPSAKAKSFYYYVLCAGHFYCDNNYKLIRDKYDSMLVLHVLEGVFTFKNSNGDFVTAKKNETVIIDCYDNHEYYTDSTVETLWLHIAGVNARELLNDVIKTNGSVIKQRESGNIKRRMLRLFEGIKIENSLREAEVSVEVYKLLMELVNAESQDTESRAHEAAVSDVKDYVASHLGEKITVDLLAAIVHMSNTHFSRIFKQKTGFSPYEYVLNVRINKAKELLLRTDMSIVEIAYETGFNSEANFIYCFTNAEGISPGKFRKIQF